MMAFKMKKGGILGKKKLVINTIYAITLLIVISLLSNSSMSGAFSNATGISNIDLNMRVKEELDVLKPSCCLAPKNIPNNEIFPTSYNSNTQVNVDNNTLLSIPIGETMWGYIANSSIFDEGVCYFDVDDPGTIEYLHNTESDDFLSGGTGYDGESWIACENSTGALWQIDPYTGNMTYIGGGGSGLNGLASDPVTNKIYGASGSSLYEIDPDTGEQTFIGSFGNGISDMIGIVCDSDGTLYGWDIGYDKLWLIDIDTAEAIGIGPLGIDLNYAQDGDYCHASGTLYLTAYTISPNIGSYLYVCDTETGECTLIGQFEVNSQITASVIYLGWPGIPSDMGVKSINYPKSSNALDSVPIQVKVKNYGYCNEITDVNMRVNKYEAESIIFEEDFSGAFPPDGWTTDWWMKSYTDYACGSSPEARCYKDTQANQGDYYDNYLMTPEINCNNYFKVDLGFKFNGDILYNNYCSFYVKYRKDLTSPWIDVTPWDNPIPEDFGCEEFIIGINDDTALGEELQIKWEYSGYYYYFNNWYIDDVKITSFNCFEEYNETIEDVYIPQVSEIIVNFPNWTPTDWQDQYYENTWQEYNVKACTSLVDDNPENDCKEKIIDLHFPFMHDVGATYIIGPDSGSAQTFPVIGQIKNFGQNDESDFKTYVEISEIDFQNQTELINQDFSDNDFPPNGWTKTHNNWLYSNTSHASSSSGEAKFFHSPSSTDSFRFYTYQIDTSNFDVIEIMFRHHVNHNTCPYILKVETSTDAINWDIVWYKHPFGIVCPENIKILTGENVGTTTYVSWTFYGYSMNINNWYIDDIFITGYNSYSPEYEDEITTALISPGEEIELEFYEWTPEFLSQEISGTKKYIVKLWTDLEDPIDENNENDFIGKSVELVFYHDVRIKKITNPSKHEWYPPEEEWIHLDDGNTVDSFGLNTGGMFEYAIRLTTKELEDYYGCYISSVKRHHGLNIPFNMNGYIKIYEQGTSTSPGKVIREIPFSCYEADWHEIPVPPVLIWGDEDIWISCKICHNEGQYPAGMDSALDHPGKGDWIYFNDEWSEVSDYGFNCDWNLWAGISLWKAPPPIAYIKPGTQDINVTIENLGTFPELNLTCWAEIYSFIEDPINGTLCYEDNITNIDLDVPLEGIKNLTFKKFNFSDEGYYGLYIKMPDDNDDKPNNNNAVLAIGVDDTKPISELYDLDPSKPDGENGWYISDVEVTISAYDPEVLGVCSWVKEIWYKIGKGDWQTIPGGYVTFTIEEDGEDILLQYYAVDYVGNKEQINSFTIDIDKTNPVIDIIYEFSFIGDTKKKGWYLLFIASATDETSGMSHVEFFLNDMLQETVYGQGPTYKWGFAYHGGLNIIVKAIANDMAGNFNSDEIVNPKNSINIKQSKNKNIQQFMYKYLIR